MLYQSDVGNNAMLGYLKDNGGYGSACLLYIFCCLTVRMVIVCCCMVVLGPRRPGRVSFSS